jgi:hypothetical protein
VQTKTQKQQNQQKNTNCPKRVNLLCSLAHLRASECESLQNPREICFARTDNENGMLPLLDTDRRLNGKTTAAQFSQAYFCAFSLASAFASAFSAATA